MGLVQPMSQKRDMGHPILEVRMRLFGVVLLAVVASAALGQRPEWETKAGGKMAFEVVSIRLSKPGTFTPPSFPLSTDDSFRPHGGNFHADFPLAVYISFAYKMEPDKASLPKWALTDYYTVVAKTEKVNATKDQMRLMVQAVLADRFKLALHVENRESPVFALMLVKPGKTGPKLRPHGEGRECDPPVGAARDPAVFPEICDVYSMTQTARHMAMLGSRNTTVELLASSLDRAGRLGRPVVDRTVLEGNWDFTIEWQPESQPGAALDPDAQGPTFLEAMNDQLGLKIEPAKASLPTLVVDHVEKPTEN